LYFLVFGQKFKGKTGKKSVAKILGLNFRFILGSFLFSLLSLVTEIFIFI